MTWKLTKLFVCYFRPGNLHVYKKISSSPDKYQQIYPRSPLVHAAENFMSLKDYDEKYGGNSFETDNLADILVLYPEVAM